MTKIGLNLLEGGSTIAKRVDEKPLKLTRLEKSMFAMKIHLLVIQLLMFGLLA